jgi:DNA-binding CsgD family transcriptional regulator
MRRLRAHELSTLLDCVRETHALRDLPTFPREIVRVLHRLISADCAWCDGAHPTRGRTTWVVEPFETFPDAQRIFSALMHEHPCFLHTSRIADGQSWRLSDFVSRSRLHRSRLYNEYYRRRGVEYQLGIRLAASRRFVIAVGVNRGSRRRNFSDDHLLLMQLLGPHLVAAYQNAAALSALKGEDQGKQSSQGLVVVQPNGGLVVSSGAHRLLERYIGWSARRSRVLPAALTEWVAAQRKLLARLDDVPSPLAALVVRRGSQELRVRLLPDASQDVLLLDEGPQPLVPGDLAQLGLTARESEVLAWVAQGKTNADTARILGTRSATVAKHLERIFRKLGVETRTAAAVRAFEAAGSRGTSQAVSDC